MFDNISTGNWDDAALREKYAKDFDAAISMIEDFRSIISKNINSENPCHAASWKLLSIYSDILVFLAQAWESKALGKKQRARANYRLLEDYVIMHDNDLVKVFDDDSYLDWVINRFMDEDD